MKNLRPLTLLFKLLTAATLSLPFNIFAQTPIDFTESAETNSSVGFNLNKCQPSQDNCDYYSCLENQTQCGRKGYLLQFGKKNCERYLTNQKFSSNTLKAWYPKARKCLQEQLDANMKSDSPAGSCQEIKEIAFDSHLYCFVEAGYCELSWIDQFVVLMVAGTDLLIPSSIKTGIQIDAACAERLINQ